MRYGKRALGAVRGAVSDLGLDDYAPSRHQTPRP